MNSLKFGKANSLSSTRVSLVQFCLACRGLQPFSSSGTVLEPFIPIHFMIQRLEVFKIVIFEDNMGGVIKVP
jgi:hypothetical protein